jgi:glycerol-3-phosphate dehydrogenase
MSARPADALEQRYNDFQRARKGAVRNWAMAELSGQDFSAPHVSRLAAAYGTRARNILAGARTKVDLGFFFGATLTEVEIRYLMAQEWAQTADDVLWRRTKLGLVLSDGEARALDRFMAATSGVGAAAQQEVR